MKTLRSGRQIAKIVSSGPHKALAHRSKPKLFFFRRIIDISTGSYYMFGGGIFSEQGFIGCMRHITIDGTYKSPGTC